MVSAAMRVLLFIQVLALVCLGYATSKNDCSTIVAEVIVPSTTATYESTAVITQHPTTADNLGTFTYVTTISTTTTLETLTSTHTACIATGIVTEPVYHTVYTNNTKRDQELAARTVNCTITSTTTSYFGQTYTFIPANKTRTFYAYTAFTEATVTHTSHGGRAYAIATATTTASVPCNNSSRIAPHNHNNNSSSPAPTPAPTSTLTLDPRCAPSALTSAWSSYGLSYQDDVPLGGAAYTSETRDAPTCCQLCADARRCSASSWDSRTGRCVLEFAVDVESGTLACGEGLLAFYDYGPVSPVAPGKGLWVAALCGNVGFGAAEPDDGS